MKKEAHKVLVTGAAGFLGSYIVAELIAQGCETFAAVRAHSDTWRLKILDQNKKCYLIDCDLLEKESIKKVMAEVKPDIVINAAAYGVNPVNNDTSLTLSTNVYAALNLLEIFSEHKGVRYLQLGSCFEYGSKDHPVKEDEVLQPTGLYGASKAAASILLLQRAKDLEIDFGLLRIFGVWGWLEDSYRLIPQVIAACQNSTPLLLSNCDQIRDYTYVKDMAKKIVSIALLDTLLNNEIINLGSGAPVILRDFVLAVANIFGKAELMKFGALSYRANEMKCLYADITKQQQLIANQEKTSIDRGVQIMLQDKNC